MSELSITDFEFFSEKNPLDFVLIKARDLSYNPTGYQIKNILQKVAQSTKPILSIKIDNIKNRTTVKSENIVLLYVNKIFEDLTGFISNLIPDSDRLEEKSP